MKTYIVIAAFNEGKKIGSVVKELLKVGYSNVVVVDDGSSDNTYSVASKAGAVALQHIVNRGQGAALQTGIDYALEQGADLIVTFDADGQHCVSDIPAMIKPVASGEVDVTLGSRFLGKSNAPFLKKLVLKGGIIFTRLLSGIKLTDVHNGFRVFSRKAAQKIRINQDRMEHASEILDEIARKKIKYKEIPVTIKYSEYSKAKGQSVFNSIRIALKMIYSKVVR